MSDTNTQPTESGAPVDDKPVDEKPVEDKTIDDKVIDDKVIDHKPVDDKPVDDKPVDDKPVDDKVIDDQLVEDTEAPEAPADEPQSPGAQAGDEVDEAVDVEATTEEPLPEAPEAELPEGFEETRPDTNIDPSDSIDQPSAVDEPVLEGSERPEAHDFTPTDGPPELVDPYDSVDMTNPWDDTTSGPDAQWGQDSLTDIGVTYEDMGGWDTYQDDRNGDAYTDYNNGNFEARVGGKHLTGDEAEAAFNDFVNTRLLSPEELERLKDNAYNHDPATGGATAGPPGNADVGGDGFIDEEQMGPPSHLAGGDDTKTNDADYNGDGSVDWKDVFDRGVDRLVDGTTGEEARRIDKEMGGDGKNSSTRGEQKRGAQEELDRQDKENKSDEKAAEKEEDEKTETETEAETEKMDHPGWGDERTGVSIFDELKNQPGRTDPRDPGNVDPSNEGYGDGGGDASETTNEDLMQPAGPDAEPSGGGGQQPTPAPIDYGPDHIDPFGSGPYDDPVDIGPGTVSYEPDDALPYEPPIEMADDGVPDFDALGVE